MAKLSKYKATLGLQSNTKFITFQTFIFLDLRGSENKILNRQYIYIYIKFFFQSYHISRKPPDNQNNANQIPDNNKIYSILSLQISM